MKGGDDESCTGHLFTNPISKTVPLQKKVEGMKMFMASFVKRAEPSKATQGTKAKAVPFTPVVVSADAARCKCISCRPACV